MSCSVFRPTPKIELSEEKIWQHLWLAACPVSSGKGQIFLPKSTYAFSYESVLNSAEQFWAMALEVPLRGEETLIVQLDDATAFSGSLLEKVHIHPMTLSVWKKNWVQLITFLHKRLDWSQQQWTKQSCSLRLGCKGQDESIRWSYKEQEIEIMTLDKKTKTSLSWKFKRKNDELIFTEQIVTLRHQKNSQTISLHLYPTTCGN